MKIHIEMIMDDDGSIQVTGNGLTPTIVETIMTTLGALGTIEAEEYEEE